MNNLKSRIDSELTFTRLDYLIQVGFTKRQIAEFSKVNLNTLRKIFSVRPDQVSMDTHLKIKAFHSNYIINKTNKQNAILEDDEPVIDSADAEQGAKEVARWMWLSLGIAVCILVALIFVIKYVISLF